MKKCPLRPIKLTSSYEEANAKNIITKESTEFGDCLEEDCEAFHPKRIIQCAMMQN